MFMKKMLKVKAIKAYMKVQQLIFQSVNNNNRKRETNQAISSQIIKLIIVLKMTKRLTQINRSTKNRVILRNNKMHLNYLK